MIRVDLDFDAAQLTGVGRQALAALRPRVRDAVEDSVMHLANAIRVKVGGTGSGRMYRRTKGGRYHTASAPGQPPARDYGDYVQSWMHDMKESDAEIEGQVGSSMWERRGRHLEDGTKRMAPRPHVVPAIEEERRAIERRLGQI